MKDNLVEYLELAEYNKSMDALPPLEYFGESIENLADHVHPSENISSQLFPQEGIAAVRNLMDLAGAAFTQEEVAQFAVEHKYAEYNSGTDVMERAGRGAFAFYAPWQMCELIREMANIQTEQMEISDEASMKQLLGKLEEGHRAIVQVDYETIHNDSVEKKNLWEKFTDAIADAIGAKTTDYVITLLRSEHPGMVTVCESLGKDSEKLREIPVERILRSAQEFGGCAIVTKDAYSISDTSFGYAKDRLYSNGRELPASHTRDMNFDALKQESPEAVLHRISDRLYRKTEQFYPGYLKQFEGLNGENSARSFSERYEQYVLRGNEMKAQNRDLYNFMMSKFFANKEYTVPRKPISFL